MIDIDEIKKGIALTQDGKYEEAEELYIKLLEQYPNESILLSTIGLFYINMQNYDKAVSYLRQACEIKESLGSVAALGFAECERKNYEEAIPILEHALNFGDNIDVYNKLILCFFELGMFSKAVKYTEKMNNLFPNQSKSIANQVKVLTKSGKLIEAKHLCTDYLKENPEDPVLSYHLGLLKELIYSDDEQAIECYKLAGQYGNRSAEYNIGVAYQKLGEYEEAEKHYKNFLETGLDNNKAKIALGLCYLTQKKFKQGYEFIYNREIININQF